MKKLIIAIVLLATVSITTNGRAAPYHFMERNQYGNQNTYEPPQPYTREPIYQPAPAPIYQQPQPTYQPSSAPSIHDKPKFKNFLAED